ncbi:ATP-binding protein, partial [Patescibacteria group bacterium]|nr:ATP-binding protein [Patescibacteria group bacterium]
FWKILDFLKIEATCLILKDIKIVSKTGEKRCTYPVDFPVTTDFLKLLGLICAEGTITERAVIITNIDMEVLGALDASLKKCEVPFFYGNKGIIISSRIFIEIIKALGGKNKSGQKKVLPFIFNLEKEKIASYISGYFEGDGGVEKGGICAVSKSKKLISEIAYLLFYFGVIGRISKTKKKTTNSNWKRKRIYWKISISGQDNLRKFAENINFISERKRKQLSEIIQKEGNTNVDLIPGLELIFQEIYRLFGFQLHGIPEISEWKREVRHPSPQNLQKIITKIEEKIQHFKNSHSTFKTLEELPNLSTVISLGKNNKELNRALWQTLGQSWRIMKNQEVEPRSNNVLKAIEVINGNSFYLENIKSAIHLGFREMELPIKYYNCSLQTALIERPASNTCYGMIQKSAQFIWENYQSILTNNIPKVEEKLKQLKILANSELFWDPITEIKKIENKKEEYVYDLTVDNEVFLAGQAGMFVHNSYAIKLEILRYLMQGIDVIVIDPENEYEALADAVGGSFFKISLTSPHQLNPFDLPVPAEGENKEDVLRSNIINLVGLLRIMLGGLSPEEDSIIDQALTETYAIRDITPESEPETWQENIPLMSDFEEVLESMSGAESLVRRIKKFTKGTYADFFNQRSNITMDKNMIVFGIRDMEESLRPMALYIVMRYIWNVVRSKLKKRILVVDEAWWLMQTTEGASFLFGLAKRARKYWLGVTTITQDVADFMKSDYGQPIITNSSMTLLLKQSPATIDVVQKVFNITEQEKYILLEAAVGEGIFFAGRKHVAIQIVASSTEDRIITTAPEEILNIRAAKKRMEGQ